MKAIASIIIFFSILIPCFTAEGQQYGPDQPAQDPCTPLVMCGGTSLNTIEAYQGIGDAVGNQLPASCLTPLTDVFFWKVTIAQGGTFDFTITPSNPCDDYDFAVYQLDTSIPCPLNLSSASLIRCDANDIYSTPNGQVGLNPTSQACCFYGSGTNPPFLTYIDANAGDQYLIAINDAGTYGCPDTDPGPVTLDFGASTAVIADTMHPRMQSVLTTCDENDHITVQMNRPVECTSIAHNGTDFTVSNGTITSAVGEGCTTGSLTSLIDISFASPLPAGNMVLSAQRGTDFNTLLDVCDTPLILPDTIHFVTDPYIPLAFMHVDSPSCKEIKLEMDLRVNCDSIAANGSDFVVTGPQDVVVQSAYGVGCDANGFTDTIVLVLQSPIQTAGTYTIKALKGTDNNTQVDSCGRHQAVGDSISFYIITFDGLIKIHPDDTAICGPGYLVLSASNGLVPPDVMVQYSWSPNIGLTDSTNATINAYITSSSIYEVSGVDNNGCLHQDTTSVVFSQRTPTLFPQTDTAICVGNTMQFKADGGVSYKWISADPSLSCDDCSTPSATPANSSTYTVIVTGEYNCTDTLSDSVIVNSSQATASPKDTTVAYGSTLQLMASGAVSYEWTPADPLNNALIADPIATITAPEIFIAHSIDSNGCAGNDSVNVQVNYKETVFIPTAFSPNNDNKNDVFRVANITFERITKFIVFNRWGEEIFAAFDNRGWDGTFNGVPQDIGAYGYLINILYPDGHEEVNRGTVTLVR